MEKKKRCPHCKKVLEIREGAKRLNTKRKFCNETCRTRFNGRVRYNKYKDEDWYKEKQNKSFNRLLSKNREHFNDLVREPNRLYQKKKTKEARKKGFCTNCFKKPARENRVFCEECLNRQKELRRLKKEK